MIYTHKCSPSIHMPGLSMVITENDEGGPSIRATAVVTQSHEQTTWDSARGWWHRCMRVSACGCMWL